MRWIAKDSSIFFREKDYVDTILIPLIPITFKEDGSEAANASEFIELVSQFIENQFKGRILLLPPFTYFRSTEEELIGLNQYWVKHIESGYFKHIIFISSDPIWQKIISNRYEVIWLPSIPLEHMNETNKMKVISNQAEQVINIIIHYWQEKERENSLQKK